MLNLAKSLLHQEEFVQEVLIVGSRVVPLYLLHHAEDLAPRRRCGTPKSVYHYVYHLYQLYHYITCSAFKEHVWGRSGQYLSNLSHDAT